MKDIRTIRTIKNIKGKAVLLRLDLNVPIKKGRVIDDFRIYRSVPTISYLKKKGARVIIIAHLGRDKKASLRTVARHLNSYVKVGFIPGGINEETRAIVGRMKNGTVIMLENLRNEKGEEQNSLPFARRLARLADIYVNDAFSVSHRAHASIVGLPKLLPSYGGLLLEEEISHLSLVHKPKHPFLFILGGAKFQTKIPLIKKYLHTADHVFVGGALANNFFQSLGFHMRASLTEKTNTDIAAFLRNGKLLLPTDVVVKKGRTTAVKQPNDIEASDIVVDAGPQSVRMLKRLVSGAKFIVFNGPLGNYEKGFDAATKKILGAIARSGAVSIIAGGDTAYLARRTRCNTACSFISTGGGATIAFLAGETLPGIEALRQGRSAS